MKLNLMPFCVGLALVDWITLGAGGQALAGVSEWGLLTVSRFGQAGNVMGGREMGRLWCLLGRCWDPTKVLSLQDGQSGTPHCILSNIPTCTRILEYCKMLHTITSFDFLYIDHKKHLQNSVTSVSVAILCHRKYYWFQFCLHVALLVHV